MSAISEFLDELKSAYKEKGLKGLMFGTRSYFSSDEKALLLNALGHRKDLCEGNFRKRDLVHKGFGKVYLFEVTEDSSVLMFSEETAITNGPQLVVYLSSAEDPEKEGLRDIVDLGPLKATKGGQVYQIKKAFKDLADFKTVVVWCKPFKVLFTFAVLRNLGNLN